MKKEEIKIRLNERLRVYRDSPTVSVTYVDLAHMIEDILEILGDEKQMGFKKDK